jgi:outer membrane protein assembly factor BamB
MICRVFLFLALASCVRLASAAPDWPEFRGPDGQGHSAARKVPTKWSATDNVAWKTPIPGSGWSSPVLQGNRVYLTTAVEQQGRLSLRVLCLEIANGKILWNTEALAAAKVRHHQKNSDASPTPILEADRLYAHFGHYGTACLDFSGKILWQQTSLTYDPNHGNGGSPALVEDRLVFNCDGSIDPFIAALDKRTGKVLWKVPRRTDARKLFSFSTPLVIEVHGRQQVISPGSGVVSALDPANGREIWRVRYGEGYSIVPRPVFGHGLVFLSSGFDRAVIYAIRPDGRGDVTDTHVAWTVDRQAPKTPSLLLVGDELYAVSDAGVASCLDARTGKEHWSMRVPGNYSASPVFADGHLYLQNETGLGVVLAVGKSFRKVAENDLGERTLASYAVSDGALYIRGEQHLFRIGR